MTTSATNGTTTLFAALDVATRGVFRSVTELKTAIEAYLENTNADPNPFIWTAKAADILEKVTRGRRVLESQH